MVPYDWGRRFFFPFLVALSLRFDRRRCRLHQDRLDRLDLPHVFMRGRGRGWQQGVQGGKARGVA